MNGWKTDQNSNLDIKQDKFEEMRRRLDVNSPYGRKPSGKKKYMTVPEMGNLLGLKKTARYWLLKKNYFISKIINDSLVVDIDSFEEWYQNQSRYHKVNGEEPGLKLKEKSLSVLDIADILEISKSAAQDLVKRAKLETVIVENKRRVPVECFEKWYEGQKYYRNQRDRERDEKLERETITIPEAAHLLGETRDSFFNIMTSSKYYDLFEFVVIGDRRRLTRKSFEHFLDSQNEYKLDERLLKDNKLISQEENEKLANFRKKRILSPKKGIGTEKYLTVEEAALLADVKMPTVVRWYKRGHFPYVKYGKAVRIYRDEFEKWLRDYRGDNGHGIDSEEA